MNEISIPKHEWDGALIRLLLSADVYAPIENEFCCDYEKVDVDTVLEIVYNRPKPVTPLKKFFLPFKENVTSDLHPAKPIIILGASNCSANKHSNANVFGKHRIWRRKCDPTPLWAL